LPALGLGPFAAGSAVLRGQAETGEWKTENRFQPSDLSFPRWVGLRLAWVGLVMVAALPWMAALESLPWLMPLPPLLLAALLWGWHWLTVGRPARRWARAYLALDIALLLALLWAAYAALRAHLA